jgi:hypothetical protein
MSRENALKIAGLLNNDTDLEGLKVEAQTWLKVPGKERVYLQTTGRKGGTRLGYVDAATGTFTPERFAGKNMASDAILGRVREVLQGAQPKAPAAPSGGLAAMAAARAQNTAQPRGQMQALSRVSGPFQRANNYAKTGRSG